MKTAHQLARELLAGPDLPIFHFDPSRAGMDEECDTSVSLPRIELTDLSVEGLPFPVEPDVKQLGQFLVVHGDGGEPGDEPGAFAELTLESARRLGYLSREQLDTAQACARSLVEQRAGR